MNADEKLDLMLNEMQKMNEHLRNVDEHLQNVDDHLQTVDGRLQNVEEHLQTVDRRLQNVDEHLLTVDERLATLETDVADIKDTVHNNYDKTLEFYGTYREDRYLLDERLDEMAAHTDMLQAQTLKNTAEIRRYK